MDYTQWNLYIHISFLFPPLILSFSHEQQRGISSHNSNEDDFLSHGGKLKNHFDLNKLFGVF
jgi:hypothetical protein